MQSESKNEKQELCLHRPAMRIEGAGKEFYVYYMFGCRGSIGTGDLDRICRGNGIPELKKTTVMSRIMIN